MTILDLVREGPAGGLTCDFCMTPWRAENGLWHRFDTPRFVYPWGGAAPRPFPEWIACADCAVRVRRFEFGPAAHATTDRIFARWGSFGWERGELEVALHRLYTALVAHIREPQPFVPGAQP